MSDDSTHPDRELLERWRSRTLAPEEILAVTRHLAVCPSCRREAAPRLSPESLARGLSRLLAEERESPEHLSAEQLDGWVDGSLDTDAAEIVASHLAVCPLCEDEAAELAAFARTGTSSRRLSRWRSWAVAGGSLAATLIVAWLAFRPEAVVAPRATPAANESPAAKPALPIAAVPTAAPAVVALRDGPLLVDASGAIRGLEERWRPRVETALRTPELVLPEATAGLARGSGQQRTESGGPAPAVRLIAPRSRVLSIDRPTFLWEGPPAWLYAVEIYDARFAKVAASGPLRVTSWVPPSPIPRGVLLTWKLTATDDNQVRAYPTAPQLPATFSIASAAEVAEVTAARASGSHLVAGLALWHAGMLEEGAAELALLAIANPDSQVAHELAAAAERGAARLRPVKSAGR